jgi:hypothetical protein
VGAATYDPEHHRTIADLLIQADEDMYADKRGA